jgi:hypothetical protein
VVGFLLRRRALSPTAPLAADPRSLMMQVGLVCMPCQQVQSLAFTFEMWYRAVMSAVAVYGHITGCKGRCLRVWQQPLVVA